MQKYYVMAIKQHLWKNALILQSVQEKILPIIFPTACQPIIMITICKDLVSWTNMVFLVPA